MRTVAAVVCALAAVLAMAGAVVAMAAADAEDDFLSPDWEEPDSERARRLRGED